MIRNTRTPCGRSDIHSDVPSSCNSDLFDPNTGIYTHPQNRSTAGTGMFDELIMPEVASTTLDCGLQIQGGTQRDPAKNAKHSFRVQFKAITAIAR